MVELKPSFFSNNFEMVKLFSRTSFGFEHLFHLAHRHSSNQKKKKRRKLRSKQVNSKHSYEMNANKFVEFKKLHVFSWKYGKFMFLVILLASYLNDAQFFSLFVNSDIAVAVAVK